MSKKLTIYLAADHAGVDFKSNLLSRLTQRLPDFQFEDLGPTDAQSVDYPDFARKVTDKVSSDPDSLGILICTTGIGMSIAANKVQGIRAALVSNPLAAQMTRDHNHSNVLCLGAGFLGLHYAEEIAASWLLTEPSQEERHLRRVAKIESKGVDS